MSKTDDLSAWRVFVTVARSGTLIPRDWRA